METVIFFIFIFVFREDAAHVVFIFTVFGWWIVPVYFIWVPTSTDKNVREAVWQRKEGKKEGRKGVSEKQGVNDQESV
jgi:hypothetical protein